MQLTDTVLKPIHRIVGAVSWRASFLADHHVFSLAERLLYVTPVVGNHGIEQLLLRRVCRAPDGSEYFDISGHRIFFRPEWAEDQAEVLRGALVIICEAYVREPEFFSPEVFIRTGDVVFDLGGNLGTSALLFSERTGPAGVVFSFEPVLTEVLKRNVRENGADNVRVVPEAVADTTGEAVFGITDLGIDSRIDPWGKGGVRKMVKTISLDDFVEREGIERVDFIKMDIEGAEEIALRGADRVIREFRPRWSIASYHDGLGFTPGEPQHPILVQLLTEYGYRIEEVEQRHIYAW